jgi:hypothetical protein
MRYLFLFFLILLLIGVVSADVTILKPTDDIAIYATSGGSWAATRALDGSGGGTDSTGWIQIWAYSTTDTWYILERTIYGYNMSSIGEDKTVTDAKVALYFTYVVTELSGTKPVTITYGTPANYANLVLTDFDNFNDTPLGSIAWGDLDYGKWCNATMNSSGINYLNSRRGTNFTLYVRDGYDVQNIAPPWSNNKQNSAQFNIMADSPDPEIDITWTSGGSAPVAAFSGTPTSGALMSLTVDFTDSSTNTPDNWDWYWSNDETKDSDTQSPQDVVFTSGTYNVRLYASNSYGGDWENKTSYINVCSICRVIDYIRRFWLPMDVVRL